MRSTKSTSGEADVKPQRKHCFAEIDRKDCVVANLGDLTMTTRIHSCCLEELAVAVDTVEKNFSTTGRIPLVASDLRLQQEAVDLPLYHRGLLAFSPMTIRVLTLRRMKAFAVARTILLGDPEDQRTVRK